LDKSRRKFVIGTALATAGAASAAAQHEHHGGQQRQPDAAGGPPAADRKVERKRRGEKSPGVPPVLVEGPDLTKLEWTMDGGVKVFRLRAEVAQREFLPGRVVNVWGFNGQMPGPIVEAFEGDRVRIVVENGLPEEFSMHWHGLEVPFDMDGVPGLQQDPIAPGGSFTYEFTLNQNGTFFYHSHMPMQEMMGMIGAFIIHPKVAHDPPVDRDFVTIWQEWAILPNNNTPNSLAMEFNWLTINGKAGPEATPMLAKKGERIRVRLINLGMDHHPIHMHGHQFVVTGTEGGRKPQSTWFKENTVILGVAQARDFEFTAEYEGAWMIHCHLPHHMMNAMASMVGPMMGIGRGVEADKEMENGMGMLQGGHALADGYGPSFGRTIGTGAPADDRTTHLPLTGPAARLQQGGKDESGAGLAGAQASGHDQHQGHGAPAGQSNPGGQIPREPAPPGQRGVAPGAPRRMGMVPGYPQDMAMVMDEIVAKPETHGLRPTWTIGMMGMMTMVRVLPPAQFDEIQALRRTWTPPEARVAAQKRGWDAYRGMAIGSSHRSGGHEHHK
jgi:FtsP/CotA-like multicopper oxidase with cupredoxin domain